MWDSKLDHVCSGNELWRVDCMNTSVSRSVWKGFTDDALTNCVLATADITSLSVELISVFRVSLCGLYGEDGLNGEFRKTMNIRIPRIR